MSVESEVYVYARARVGPYHLLRYEVGLRFDRALCGALAGVVVGSAWDRVVGARVSGMQVCPECEVRRR